MTINNPIHFHWRLVQGGEESFLDNSTKKHGTSVAWPDLVIQNNFCKTAEKLGIESVLVDINYAKPDPTLLSMALCKENKKLGFIIAVRSGLLSPTLFTQQINTMSTFSNGRIYLNVVAGHNSAEQKIYGDFLSHDERYARTHDFLNICTKFWNNNGPVNLSGQYIKVEEGLVKTPYVSDHSKRPFIFIGGGSQPAINLTLKFGDCWMQFGDTPENVRQRVAPVIEKGKAAGLRFSVICRPTHDEALAAANKLLENTSNQKEDQNRFVTGSDSQSIKRNYIMANNEWPVPNLWTGAVKTFGPASMAIVGSYEAVAKKIIEYKHANITHFILSGWPKLEEMKRFGTYVIPLIRTMEKSIQSGQTNG